MIKLCRGDGLVGKNVCCTSNRTSVLMSNIYAKSRHGPVCLKCQYGGKRKADLWNLLASQPSHNGKLPVQ